ncbi:hypothetical protein PHJA_002133500 [Phtheirospermum japonicum]|uniref:Inner centromere protein ARK-binding domain-containing protein n=1 Tax=Phtheirospermum japonicum TaxID=374723 RepID=A0A830CUL8_9LAMI|nr:hypothetical protein PHJA_002133500 [Phtheirospermum japonicum]
MPAEMTTVEKLLVQIFERRNSIIEQVKQQKELYSQHLASKLLIDGITPPSWLWSPNTSSDSNELNKEELISKLLRPYPQPSACCSVAHYPVYDNLVVRGDNEEFSDGVFMENMDIIKGFNRQDHPTAAPLSSEDRAGCALDCVPEPDASVTSPEDQTDERILNIYNAPDPSLAGIQRSKSRQKALQLRNSATALAKSGVSLENVRDVSSSHIKFSLSATNQAGQDDELLKLAKPCVTGSQSCADWDDKADSRSKEKEKSADAGRITRSRSNIKAPDFVRGSLTLGCSSENCKENASSHISEVRRTQSMHISDSQQTDNYVNKWPKSAGPSTVHCQSCGDTKVNGADCLSNDRGTGIFAGRITGSNISSKCQSCGRDSSKSDISSEEYQRIDTVMMESRDDLPPDSFYGSPLNPSNVLNGGCDTRESISGDCQSHRARGSVPSCSSNQQNACVDEVSDPEIRSYSAKADNGILAPLSGKSAQEVNDSMEAHGFVKPSVGLFRRMTRSQSRSDFKELYEPVAYNENSSLKGTVSKSDFKQNSAANDEIQITSSGQFGPSCNEAHDMLDEHENASFLMANKLVLCDHVDRSGSNSSSDAKHRREMEFEVSPTASDSFVFVEPKQLDFNGFEECNLKPSTSNSGKQRLNNSPEKMRCSFPDPAVSLDKRIYVGVNQLSLGKQSSGTSEENPDNQAEESGPIIIGTMLNNSENKTEAGINCKISEVYCEADGILSKMVDVSDVQIHPMKLYMEDDGLEALLKRHVEEGDWSGEGKRKSRLVSNAPGSENLRASEDQSQLVSCTPGSENARVSKDKSQSVPCTPGSENARVSKDKNQSVPCTPGSENAYNSAKEPRAESCDTMIGNLGMLNQICGVLDKMKQFHAQQSQVSSCLEGGVCSQHRDSPLRDNVFVTYGTVYPDDECSSPRRRLRHASMESWPQLKRRKIEHQQIRSSTTSPSFRVRKPGSTQRGPASTYLKNMNAVDTFHVDEHIDIEIPPDISKLVEGIECSFSCPNGEVIVCTHSLVVFTNLASFVKLMQVEFCYKEKNEHKYSSPVINNEQLGTAFVSSLKKESTNSQGCFIEETSDTKSSNHFDASELGDGQHSQHLCDLEKDTDNLSSVNLILTNAMLEEMQSPKWESGLQAQHSVLSPRTEDLELIDVDQSMPVLEGFIVDAQEDNGELDFAADGIDFEKLKLSSNTIERASILAEICRSASLDKPSSHFSSAFEFQGNQSLYQSVPNGHLEHLDLASINSDVGEQLPSGRSSVDDCMESLERMPFSDGLSYSGARYSWNLRSLHASPVGKLWERLSSHTGSSEKRLSSNPELTCFPIEEDVSISEENKTVADNAGDFHEEVDSSLAKHSDKRQPLKDLSNLGLNSPMTVSAHKKTSTAGSVGFLRTKLSSAKTQDKLPSGQKNKYRNKSETSEEQTSSVGATDARENQTSLQGTNGIKKIKESINGSISKSLLSIKSGLKRQDQKLSLKARRNNIVSNVSSFIPLVQQKQAATVCAGKRDVKVKALGAAEAAKRLEEKKENERKMRKEALKLERAKLEEKNLRQLELEKKKKEEERKKKDADIVAKKRQREEDERKEKENKRMRLEARHRQREQEEKLRAGKAEKENRVSKDGPMNGKKGFPNESKNQQNREMVRGDDALKKADTKLNTTEVVRNYEECSTSGQSCEVEKAMHAVDTSPKNEDLIVRDSRGKSYEISPYQCSDDEEEEDELPTKKSIPSWAR